MNNKNKYIFGLILFILGLVCGFIINQNLVKKNVQPQSTGNIQTNINTSTKSAELSSPYLDLPLEYFSKKDVQWGSAGNGNGDKITDYTQAAIKNMAVYQSYPVTNTTIESYSNEKVDLDLLSQTETQKKISSMEPTAQYKAEKSYEEFGALVSHYLPDEYIYEIEKLDVDGDGSNESIVGYSQTFTAGFGSYRTDIIKGNNVIFSVTEDNASIIPAETSNGFYVEWGQVGDPNGGRCCEEGIKRTRFVFKDGKFVPIYEQEVKYLKVGKE